MFSNGWFGFVGTNLIKRLLNEGHNVVSLDNLSGKKENYVDGCVYHEIDLCDVRDYSKYINDCGTIFRALLKNTNFFDRPSSSH